VGRRARRHGLAAQILADRLLDALSLRPVDATVLTAAARVDPELLRTLDAIHLATALSLEDLDMFISYDAHLNEAAAAAGLNVESPA
jgi:uncharacterized protein